MSNPTTDSGRADDLCAVTQDLTRPIIGIEYRSGEEAHAIMADRILSALKSGRITAANATTDQSAEIARLRAALKASEHLASLYERLWKGGVVRDLAEAIAHVETADAALNTKDDDR